MPRRHTTAATGWREVPRAASIRPPRGGAVLLVVALVVAALVVGQPGSPVGAAAPTTLLPLHATRGANPGIFDSAGRQVVLRGVNYNSLGDYYQANPAYPTVIPYDAHQLDRMAAEGFDVVRLIVSWSALEPTPGTIDTTYLDRIHQAVDDAKARGIYTVIDMHQDAWGKFIASPPGTVCPAGTSPAIGWDGAPEWATITNGASTCRGTSREDSEAAATAWDSFYADVQGIQTHLVEVWRRLGTEFAHEPAVAGYDLLNEPNPGHLTTSKVQLGHFYGRSIQAIREAEDAAGGDHHIAFFETGVFGAAPAPDFTADTNIVFAPHNYGESIGGLPIEGLFKYFTNLAVSYGTTLWTGEFGWFSDPATNGAKAVRFGQQEDLRVVGGTWWQWWQACGDPHSIGTPGGTPAAVLIHFVKSTCPGDGDLGPVPEWVVPMSRPYPRAAPGRVTSLTSDGANATLALHGQAGAAVGATLDLWVPDHSGAHATTPALGGTGLAGLELTAVAGGWRATAQVCVDGYTATVAAAGTSVAAVPATCDGGTTTTTAGPAGSSTTTTVPASPLNVASPAPVVAVTPQLAG